MQETGTVHVVEDDPGVREWIATLLRARGLALDVFPDGIAFLRAFLPGRAGCLVVDVRLPGMSGLELQQRLRTLDDTLPVIVMSGHADVPMAVRAMRAGAVDFIEKPFPPQRLLEGVERALALDAERRRRWHEEAALRTGLERLNGREREILRRVAAGRYNKVIAAELGISVSTVEAHRRRVMQQLGAQTLYDLVRAAELDAERSR